MSLSAEFQKSSASGHLFHLFSDSMRKKDNRLQQRLCQARLVQPQDKIVVRFALTIYPYSLDLDSAQEKELRMGNETFGQLSL
jgi:hypothetical protein